MLLRNKGMEGIWKRRRLKISKKIKLIFLIFLYNFNINKLRRHKTKIGNSQKSTDEKEINAVGDVHTKDLRQVVTFVADGTVVHHVID